MLLGYSSLEVETNNVISIPPTFNASHFNYNYDDAMKWCECVSRLFPDYKDLELRVIRILEAITCSASLNSLSDPIVDSAYHDSSFYSIDSTLFGEVYRGAGLVFPNKQILSQVVQMQLLPAIKNEVILAPPEEEHGEQNTKSKRTRITPSKYDNTSMEPVKVVPVCSMRYDTVSKLGLARIYKYRRQIAPTAIGNMQTLYNNYDK